MQGDREQSFRSGDGKTEVPFAEKGRTTRSSDPDKVDTHVNYGSGQLGSKLGDIKGGAGPDLWVGPRHHVVFSLCCCC